MTPERHSPAPARFVETTDRALPVHTPLRKQRQRDRFVRQLNTFTLYPDEGFGPGCQALTAARFALEQRNLELACRKLTLEIDTHAAYRFKPYAGFHLHKSRQHSRHAARIEILGYANAHRFERHVAGQRILRLPR